VPCGAQPPPLRSSCRWPSPAQLSVRPRGPWDDWHPPAVAYPEPNGYDVYLETFKLLEEIDARHREPPEPNPDPATWKYVPREHWWDVGPEDLTPMQRLEEYAEVMATARRAIAMDCRFPPALGIDDTLPPLAQASQTAGFFGLEAHVRAENGKTGLAAGSALDCFEIANDVLTRRCEFALIIAPVIVSTGMRSLQEALPGLSAEECQSTIRRLADIEAQRVPMSEIIDGQEVLVRSAFKELLLDPRNVAILWELWVEPLDVPEGELTGPINLEASWAQLTTYFDELRARSELPYPERQEPERPACVPARLLVASGWQGSWARDADWTTDFALARAELAARLFLLDQGRLPADLTSLVPQYLDRVPLDEFANAPLRSRMADGALVIYSIGPDGEDNGGEHKSFSMRYWDKGDIAVRVEAP